jgi:hypothetical protein
VGSISDAPSLSESRGVACIGNGNRMWPVRVELVISRFEGQARGVDG